MKHAKLLMPMNDFHFSVDLVKMFTEISPVAAPGNIGILSVSLPVAVFN